MHLRKFADISLRLLIFPEISLHFLKLIAFPEIHESHSHMLCVLLFLPLEELCYLFRRIVL